MIAPGHVAITGAAGAIGAALARAMRKAWPDLELALVDRDRAGLERTAQAIGGRATIHVADLCDLDALPDLIDEIAASGPIDGLVNCAGIMRVQQLASWQWDDASELLAIDLLAPLRLQDLVVRAMVAGGGVHGFLHGCGVATRLGWCRGTGLPELVSLACCRDAG